MTVTTYFASLKISKENVTWIVTQFFNGLRVRDCNSEGVIKRFSTGYLAVQDAVKKNIGLHFNHSGVDFYCLPLMPHDDDHYGFVPRGKNNIDLASPYEPPYFLSCVVWPYLSLHDFRYYLMVKLVHEGCPLCKSKEFHLDVVGDAEKTLIEISLETFSSIEFVTTKEWVISITEKIDSPNFKCQGCSDSFTWCEIWKMYSLRWFVG